MSMCWNVHSVSNPANQNGWICDGLGTMREKPSKFLALSEVRCKDIYCVSDLNEKVNVHSVIEL